MSYADLDRATEHALWEARVAGWAFTPIRPARLGFSSPLVWTSALCG